MKFSCPHALAATVAVLVLYAIASFAIRNRWDHKVLISPLRLLATQNGRASLAGAQVFFFTLIVLWLTIYWVFREGQLVPVDNSVLLLLGVATIGSGLGKVTDSTRFRVTAENWAWAKKKGWIKKDFTQASADYTPRIGDLLTTNQNFDITRFQSVGFSLVVGIALLYNGATAADASAFSKFTIDDAYLVLIGVSQGGYVGGKYIGGNLFQELNEKLKAVRSLEVAFATAVVRSEEWKNSDAENRTVAFARDCAPKEYIAYMAAAEETGEVVSEMTGNVIDVSRNQPTLPAGL